MVGESSGSVVGIRNHVRQFRWPSRDRSSNTVARGLVEILLSGCLQKANTS